MKFKHWIKENVWLIVCVIFVIILLFLSIYIEIVTNTIYTNPNDVWEYIKESEEQHLLSGKIISVDYIDCGYNCDYALVVLDKSTYHFKDWDYANFKNFEGEVVEILCYTTGFDGYYSLSCANWEKFEQGYIKRCD